MAIVGGRPFDWSKEEIEGAMRKHRPESIQKHVVEMLGTVFPPKQVVATVTGWDRTSFTTMEAQRVLTQAGFVCRRAGATAAGQPAWVHDTGEDELPGLTIETLESRLDVVTQALAALQRRVEGLESAA
ncbi:MAG: hypothetical protein ACXVX9_03235 [Mycobacteriaceae bacterium]